MSENDDAIRQMLIAQNKQLLDANKMLHAFLCAVLTQKHNSGVLLSKSAIEENFYNYNVTWNPVIEGSDTWVLRAEPKKDAP